MRVWKLIPAMAFLFYAASASAQGWIEYVNTDDFFAVNFPGEPRVEEFIYVSEFSHLCLRAVTSAKTPAAAIR